MGYRPQSSDTSEAADRVFFDLLRRMSPSEKWRYLVSVQEGADRLAMQGLRRRFPAASERELLLRLGEQRYGPALIRRAFGWSSDAPQASECTPTKP